MGAGDSRAKGQRSRKVQETEGGAEGAGGRPISSAARSTAAAGPPDRQTAAAGTHKSDGLLPGRQKKFPGALI
eukprot:3398208-Pyramimonas_sp.AAC.1